MSGEFTWDQSIAKFAVSGSIGGSAVAAGASATGDVTIEGASAILGYNSSYQLPAGGSVFVSPAFAGGPGAGFVWTAYLHASLTDTIVVSVTNVTAGSLTPTAGNYAVSLVRF